MSEDEENVQNESEEQFKIEDLDDIYKSQDLLDKEINNNNLQDDSIEDNANYNYISGEIQKEELNNKNNNDIINNTEEINYNKIDNNYYFNEMNNNINNEDKNIINIKEPEGPINLIEFHKNNFILNEKALNILNTITEDLIIVSIVGKARTGKSYLMNLLLNNNNSSLPPSGFQISSRLSSCTKGIWLWNTPRTSPQSQNTKIIFIDSEGTNSTDLSTKTYDSKIFALIVLISSLFIYNTHGNIDERSIGDLALAAHLSNTVATNVIEDDLMINKLAPKFIWVLRDFVLDKIDPETGKEITSNEYLELCLRNKLLGKNGVGMENNLIRENIIKYFKERECITLPRPVDLEEDLYKLDEIPFEQLKPNFRSEFLKLKTKVYEEARIKRIGNKKINGPILVGLLTQFIKSLNSKIIPNINTAIENIIINEIEKSYEKNRKLWKKNYIKINTDNMHNIRDIYNIKYFIMNEYSSVLNENKEIKYTKKFMEIYDDNKNKLEKEIQNDISELINNKNNRIKNIIIKDVINKYENVDIYSNANFDKLNLEKKEKNLILKLLENNFNIFIQDLKNNSIINNNNNDIIFDIIIKQDKKNSIKAIKEITEISKKEFNNTLNEINKEIKKEELNDISNEINQMNTINETLNTKYDLLNEELDIKEKELSHLIGKYTRLAEKKEKILKNIIKKKREQNSLTLRSQRNQNDVCGITVETNEKGCGCEIGDFCSIF